MRNEFAQKDLRKFSQLILNYQKLNEIAFFRKIQSFEPKKIDLY